MKINFKDIWNKFKEFWSKLAKKTKTIILAVAGGVLALIIILVIWLNVAASQYQVIFPGMTSAESAEVYAALQEMGVQPQIDNRGQVLVPANMWDTLVFQLNSQGYPKTTLSYDTFTSATGFTSTEWEKQKALIFQQQERTQQTLMRQTGVADAVVTFTVPETSNYIWDAENAETSSANVTVTMQRGYDLTPERVSAIKHLAATSVPRLSVDDVVVIDGATGREMPDLDDVGSATAYNTERLDYEEEIARRIEERVVRLLTPRYGEDGVTAVASVQLDYDRLMTETKTYQSANDGGNTGVIYHLEESLSSDSSTDVGGLVGEENNTDAPPIYPNDDGTGDGSGSSDYYRHIDYDVSYIMTQIEKGEPLLERATLAVIVDDNNFTLDVQDTLVALISRATNINTENIRVTNLQLGTQGTEPAEPTPTPTGLTARQRLILIIGGVLLLLILILVIVILSLRAKKKRKKEEEAAAAALASQAEIDREIEEHKRMLQSEAFDAEVQKDNAITQEIRDFAKNNPEITANLLRSMLREEV